MKLVFSVFVGLLFVLLLLVSCAKPEDIIKQNVEEAGRLIDGQDVAAAVALLEETNLEYPKRLEVLEALAFASSRSGDGAGAAFYYEQVALLDESRPEMFLYGASAFQALAEWGSAVRLVDLYLQRLPEDADAWKQLGDLYRQSNQKRSALDAYLKFFTLKGDAVRGEHYLLAARLFSELGNSVQAAQWFEKALNVGDEAGAEAMEGLIASALQLGDYPQLEQLLDYTKSYLPELLTSPVVADAESVLGDWQKIGDVAQEGSAAQAELSEELAAQAEAAVVDSGEAIEATLTEEALPGKPLTELPAQELPGLEEEAPPIEVARVEPDALEPSEVLEAELSATPGPKPLTVGVVEPEPELSEPEFVEMETEIEVLPPPPPTLTEQGMVLLQERSYEGAIDLFWQAINRGSSTGPSWYGLAQAYELSGQPRQAEIAILEAMRVDEYNIEYTLRYLRIIQQTQTPDRIMKATHRAQTRFPNNPELLLALARTYERVAKNQREAEFYYQKFLQLAPLHPAGVDVRKKLGLE